MITRITWRFRPPAKTTTQYNNVFCKQFWSAKGTVFWQRGGSSKWRHCKGEGPVQYRFNWYDMIYPSYKEDSAVRHFLMPSNLGHLYRLTWFGMTIFCFWTISTELAGLWRSSVKSIINTIFNKLKKLTHRRSWSWTQKPRCSTSSFSASVSALSSPDSTLCHRLR